MKLTKKSLLLILALLVFVAISLPAAAQSCALCYTQAAGAGTRFIQALKSGILVLIFPPLFISTGLFIMGYRKRNSSSEDSPDRSKENEFGW